MSFKSRQAVTKTVITRDRGARLSRSSLSILIVDDSETVRKVLRGMLAQLGFPNVDEAADGRAALAMIRTRSYPLIISDWHMEPMNGLDLLQEVRRISKPGLNKFVFSTSESSWGSKTTAKASGAEGFLVKPFTVGDLETKIKMALQI